MQIEIRTEIKHDIQMQLNETELKILLYALDNFQCISGELEDCSSEAHQMAEKIREQAKEREK